MRPEQKSESKNRKNKTELFIVYRLFPMNFRFAKLSQNCSQEKKKLSVNKYNIVYNPRYRCVITHLRRSYTTRV